MSPRFTGPARPKNAARVYRAVGTSLVLLLWAVVFPLNAQETRHRIGVLAMEGPEHSLLRWSKTATYLEDQIPGHVFEIVPVGFDSIVDEVSLGHLDFVLANPAVYAELEAWHGVRRIATLRKAYGGTDIGRFGGVLFCRRDAGKRDTVRDLRGARCAAVAPNSFGGYLAVATEMSALGRPPDRVFESVSFLGTHSAVVEAVVSGEFDCGIVRTQVLEQHADRYGLDINNLRVIRPAGIYHHRSFPFVCSTRLYPEWPMAVLPHVDTSFATTVAATLMSIDSGDAAAIDAGISDWTIAANYQPVHDALRAVGAPPYANTEGPTLRESLEQHFGFVLGFLGGLAILTAMLLSVRRHRKQARESEHFLQSVIDSIPDRIRVVDRERNVKLTNRAALASATDASAGETGAPADATDVHKVPSAAHGRALDDLMRNGKPFNLRSETDGETFDTTVAPLYNRYGRITHAVEIARDVTELVDTSRALRESEALFRAIAENAQDALIVMDGKGRITYWNDAAERIFGYKTEETKDRRIDALVAPEHDRDSSSGLVGVFRSGSDAYVGRTIEVDACRQDGTAIPVELSVGALELSGERHTVAIVRDITERRRSAEQLEAAIKRAQSLAETAEAANEAKSAFLANMSHEIRTPMNGIIGMTDLLLDTELDEEQKDFTETIEKSADALLVVINDILDYSKIEAGKLELETVEFDLHTLIGDLNDVLAVRPQQKGLEYVCEVAADVPAKLRGDPGRLRQVLTNLVGNAVKFTDRGELSLSVHARSKNEREVELEFSVRDTGMGIPHEKQQALFEPFTQADVSTTRRYGGTGLGLSIATHLVELMDGAMWVESTEGEGSTFSFTARYALGSQEATGRVEEPGHLEGRRILVVDDNETNRRILLSQLRRWGCDALPAESAHQAHELLVETHMSSHRFDLVIIDMLMPEIDGATLGEWIKATPEIADIPLVMMTSAGAGTDYRRMREIGFATCLGKPVKERELKSHLERLIAGAQDMPETPKSSRRRNTAAADSSTQRLHILLAEDNPTNQKVAQALLEKLGHRVKVAADGYAVLDELKNHDFDIVLMDVQMPEMDGLEATRLLREPTTGVRNPQIPVVAMTAHSMKGDRERFLAAGMDHYIAKPIDSGALAEVIAETCNTAGHVAESEADADSEKTVPKDTSGRRKPTDTAPSRPIDGEDSRGQSHLQTLDPGKLFELFDGDAELITPIIEEFVEDAGDKMAELEGSVADLDYEVTARTAHTLKGAAANVGAEMLSSAAKDLETSAKAADETQVGRHLEAIQGAFRELKEYSRNELLTLSGERRSQ